MTLNDQNASPPPPPGAPPPSPASFGRLRNYFLTGLILVGPIYITINLTWWFINWVDDAMRPFIPISLRTETYLPFRVPGYGLIIALVALTLLGFLTAGLVGRTFVEFGENLLNRMPIVRPIYKTMKQIFETLFSKIRLELRQGGAGGIPDRHVVGGVRRVAAERGHGGASAGQRLRVVLPAVHAEPDHRVLLLCAA